MNGGCHKTAVGVAGDAVRDGAGDGVRHPMRIGLTGGIGSGKSTVARVFSALGAPIYDTDSRAKALMNTDPVIRAEVTDAFGAQSYAGGVLNRPHIAAQVFADHALLARLDAIVHPRVAEDFERWAEGFGAGACIPPYADILGVVGCVSPPYLIIESAILFESGFERFLDSVVTVSAPIEQRIERASARDGVPPELVRQRMAAQLTDADRALRADHEIVNGNDNPILPQILQLHHLWSVKSGVSC